MNPRIILTWPPSSAAWDNHKGQRLQCRTPCSLVKEPYLYVLEESTFLAKGYPCGRRVYQETILENRISKWINSPCSDCVLTKQCSEEMAFPVVHGANCSNSLSVPQHRRLQWKLILRRGIGIRFKIPRVGWKFIYHENLLWESPQEGIEEMFRKRYPHLNPPADCSQNWNEVLPSLQWSANPYLIQWLQTTEEEEKYTQNTCFGYPFLLNKVPQTMVIYCLSGVSVLTALSWVFFCSKWFLSPGATVTWRLHSGAVPSKRAHPHGWRVLVVAWGLSWGCSPEHLGSPLQNSPCIGLQVKSG